MCMEQNQNNKDNFVKEGEGEFWGPSTSLFHSEHLDDF